MVGDYDDEEEEPVRQTNNGGDLDSTLENATPWTSHLFFRQL